MKTRFKSKQLSIEDLSKIKNEMETVNLKRKQNTGEVGKKTIKRKPNFPIFKINYKKPYLPLILNNLEPFISFHFIEGDFIEYSLTLKPYQKYFHVADYSYLTASNMIEDLQRVYESKISSLKPEKIEIIRKPKQNTLNHLEVENERLENALLKKDILSRLFGIKVKQFYHALEKIREDKSPKLEGKGRKTKIKQEYLQFITETLIIQIIVLYLFKS